MLIEVIIGGFLNLEGMFSHILDPTKAKVVNLVLYL